MILQFTDTISFHLLFSVFFFLKISIHALLLTRCCLLRWYNQFNHSWKKKTRYRATYKDIRTPVSVVLIKMWCVLVWFENEPYVLKKLANSLFFQALLVSLIRKKLTVLQSLILLSFIFPHQNHIFILKNQSTEQSPSSIM